MMFGIKDICKRFLPPTTAMVDRRIDTLLRDNASLREEFNEGGRRLSRISDGGSVAHLLEAAIRLREHSREAMHLDGCVVSVASYGKRIGTVVPMLLSMLFQSARPEHLLLCLPVCDFPNRHSSLPSELDWLIESSWVEICWVEDDLGPHNKYQMAMRRFPDHCVVTFDDDTVYQLDLLEALWTAHMRHPDSIIAMRTHAMRFDGNGMPLPYLQWEYEQSSIVDCPSSALFPTGLGGVLYPPHSLPERIFDAEAIKSTCLYTDDLWLKLMSAQNETAVVNPDYRFVPLFIGNSQDNALSHVNYDNGGNDEAIGKLLEYFKDDEAMSRGLQFMSSV